MRSVKMCVLVTFLARCLDIWVVQTLVWINEGDFIVKLHFRAENPSPDLEIKYPDNQGLTVLIFR